LYELIDKEVDLVVLTMQQQKICTFFIAHCKVPRQCQEVWPTRDAQSRIVKGLQPDQLHAIELKRKRQKPKPELEDL